MNIGIIAEDDSDVGVLSEVTLTLLRPNLVGFKKFVGRGSGRLRRKCASWALNLVQQGCLWIVVVHDLDHNKEGELRAQLTDAIAPAGARSRLVLIPRREIEAWLLYDSRAIATAFHEHALPQLPGNPEALMDPKKHLSELIRKKYGKKYLNTVHNAQIAKHINVALLRGSWSFAPHFEFTRTVRDVLRRPAPPRRGAGRR
jgi:hypothetical protein